MASNRSKAWRLLPRSFGLMQGESTVASLGIVLAAILVAVLVASGYWLARTQRHTQVAARQRQVSDVAEMLALASERMLALDDVTTVRLLVMDAGLRYELDRCRIVLPDGGVLADIEPLHITVDLQRAQWQDVPEAAPVAVTSGGMLTVTQPLLIAGRSGAQLEITAALTPSAVSFWEDQAGVGLIGAASLVVLLLAYRYFRRRLRAIGVIRESLLALHSGETAESALAIASDLGDEAVTWNKILSDQENLRRQTVVHSAKESLGAHVVSDDDLTGGCNVISHGLVLINDKGRVKYANNAASVLLETSPEAMAGQPTGELFHSEELARAVEQAVGSSRRRETLVVDSRASGGSGVLRFSIRPVRRGDPAVAMVVIEDITQQRVADEAAHEFVAQATHELRTPLTNIRLYLETALDEGDSDPTVRAQCLNVINQESHRLERMVGDLLSVAEIEAGSLQVKHDDVCIDQVLHDIEADFQAQAREKRIELRFEIPPKLPVVQADRDKMVVAVHNLIGNALKYTLEGGRVIVRTEADKGELSIEVVDTGIGIGPDDLQCIFDKFYRAQDKRIDGVTGSGLGLALAREVVRLHGGDITVESQLDHGSTFTMTLPVDAGATATALA